MEIGSSTSHPAAAMPFGKMLIVGACGFIGANLCRYFAARGAPILAVDGPSGSDWRLRDLPGVTRVKLDLCSRADLHAFMAREQPSIVINCAAYGGYATQDDAERIYRVNFDG